ncbi:universal stress protein [Pseudomonas cavernae]|uniref:Universal stress protein n=1 Tax=Pseudomonas cavernae TaxID=2320867 RepID=A0A385Z3U4_9PSED|nr:universal stress protein [Pseudomonas cavernae]AYC33776.1 universal stress protein [Pseudomonas cavernae]
MNRLLVATDLSARSDRAVQRAALLARRFACDWTLLHVVDDDGPRALIERRLSDARELLENRVEGLALIAGRRPQVLVLVGDIEQTVSETAVGSGCQLLVLGMHRKSLLREIFTGTSTERIIRSSRLPVLRVGATPETDYQRLLLATDLSRCSALAVQTCRELGLLEGSEVNVVHVFDAFVKGEQLFAGSDGETLARGTQAAEAEIEARLQRFLREQRLELPAAQVRIEEGFSVVVLKRLAEELAPDLLVIGTHERSGLKKMMLGSVAETLLSELQRDILCVPMPLAR